MLIKPTLESLMKRVDSKYTLVTLAAKLGPSAYRWRQTPCRCRHDKSRIHRYGRNRSGQNYL